jgi:hypothetical protein
LSWTVTATAPPRTALTTRCCACSPRTRSPSPRGLGSSTPVPATLSSIDAPRARAYLGWNYVLVQAGPHEARTWRSDEGRWFTALPELMFPADHSWLLSSLWDDAWACVGGSADLISALLIAPELRAGAERTDPSIPRYVADESAGLDARAAAALARCDHSVHAPAFLELST